MKKLIYTIRQRNTRIELAKVLGGSGKYRRVIMGEFDEQIMVLSWDIVDLG